MSENEAISQPRIVVIGAGSIGRRHASNLKALGVDVYIYDVDCSLAIRVAGELGFVSIKDLEGVSKNNGFSAAIVCTPSHLHMQVALTLAAKGVDLFIEKPLSHTLDGVQDLIDLARAKQLICMCGYNLRFEQGLRMLKQLVNPSMVAFAEIEFGSYLPDWRPGADYRMSYSANKKMGGGIILDGIHEVDYACWILGYPDSVRAAYGKFSDLQIDVEDTVDYQFCYPDKTVVIHLDYIQKEYVRKCKVGLKNGDIIEWEFGRHVNHLRGKAKENFDYMATFDKNQMYFDEMKYFLDCISSRKQPESDLTNGARTLEIALSAMMDDG